MNRRDLYKAMLDERPKPHYGFCDYCGRPCEGAACTAHRSLLSIDPHYSLKGRTAA